MTLEEARQYAWEAAQQAAKRGIDVMLAPDLLLRLLAAVIPTSLQTYRHYKGGTYTLLWVAANSEERTQRMAVYFSHETRFVWVRPWLMFNEPVVWPDGAMRARFTPITETESGAEK